MHRIPGRVQHAEGLIDRRGFIGTATVASLSLALPGRSAAALERLAKPVRLGVIADLHHDVMHDGARRLDAFLQAMSQSTPDAIMQLGDFAYPGEDNGDVIDRFNNAHPQSLHVIGNHDMDAGFTREDCLRTWGMPGRYYAQDIQGLTVLVLDGNDPGSPTHAGGYASYLGQEQVEWLKEQLETRDGPIIVASHQPLAGASSVDNAVEIQEILSGAADKVILAINGHSHIDQVTRIGRVTYLHVNSASYKWVGGDHRHESYPAEIHAEHPWISYTCPYRDCLHATITVDPATLAISVKGQRSSWVGSSPAQLGIDRDPSLTNGEEIAPRIRDRQFFRAVQATPPAEGSGR